MKTRKLIVLIIFFLPSTFLATDITTIEKSYDNVFFSENKGQISDQNYKPRLDILFSGSFNGLTFHIKNDGISYQLNRVDEYKDIYEPWRELSRKEIVKQTIYRVDVNWLNTNRDPKIATDGQLPGYNNYYSSSCPNGALNVKSYKGIRLNNIYSKIDLHYYEKEGQLKYDYIVSPGGDYKLIQLEIKGAKIQKNKNGTLFLQTPLGDIEEGAPLVYQNGKQLKAKWIIKNNILSFDIENYDPKSILIIDPVARLWGTYYGGNSAERCQETRTDASGNVYLTGHTGSTNNIATVGAQQFNLGGGPDAFLVKFDSNGVRQWGTYYGSNNNDYGESCCIDPSGNVYMTGFTNSNNSIATPGAHQTTYSGGTYDGLFVKFNSSGVRLWSTYYGANGDDRGYSCCLDNAGNLYLAGYATSTVNIATPGAHQTTYGGGSADGILIQFNTNGVRQWGTYYGGSSIEQGEGCCIDAFGDVCLAGVTGSSNNISSTGAHQSALGGGWDGFITKFNSSGVRQWGTYYGGTATDNGKSCCADALGNVYLTGSGPSGNNISTPGAHQMTSGGGVSDAFLVKFNTAGVRQWGTYYGGSVTEYGYACTCDASNNVYLGGMTSSFNNISSAGAFQFGYGGGTWDAFFVRFDTGGIRLWGTYYGGSADDYVESCSGDLSGNVYLCGWTNSTNSISSAGAHQTSMSTGSDSYLVKFRNCPIDYNLSTTTSTPLCIGSPLNFSTTVTTTITLNYDWQGPASFTSSLQNPGITNAQLVNSGDYTITASDGTGCKETVILSVTVNPLPVVTISPNNSLVCNGGSVILTAGGASTYTWNTSAIGYTITDSPIINTSYTVAGTDLNGCENTAITSVSIVSQPTISIIATNTIICAGTTVTLTAIGANTFTWNTSSTSNVITDTPMGNSSYTVSGTDANGCENSTVANITVNQLPIINLTTSDSIICGPPFQGTVTLTASGAASYTWSTSETSSSIVVTPSVNTVYTVNCIDVNGCENAATITQNVSACIGVKDIDPILNEIKIYPNPNNGYFTIELPIDVKLEIINSLGEIIFTENKSFGKERINLLQYNNGIYLIRVISNQSSVVYKIVKE